MENKRWGKWQQWKAFARYGPFLARMAGGEICLQSAALQKSGLVYGSSVGFQGILWRLWSLNSACLWERKTGPGAPYLFGKQMVHYQLTVVSPGPSQSNLFLSLEGIQQIISYYSKIFFTCTVGKSGTWIFFMAILCRHLVFIPTSSDVQRLVALWFPKKSSSL